MITQAYLGALRWISPRLQNANVNWAIEGT
jgi:hypothetical protein